MSDRIPRDKVWRYRLSARVVIYSIALGAVEDLESTTTRLFWHAFSLDADDLRTWVAELEKELRAKGKLHVVQFAEEIVGDEESMPLLEAARRRRNIPAPPARHREPGED